jgi:hypothetical protein
MDNPSSPLETLRQLKEMLDAGALTPAEFEALKQRLVFSPPTATSPPAAGPAATPPAAPLPVAPPAPVIPVAPPPPTFTELQSPLIAGSLAANEVSPPLAVPPRPADDTFENPHLVPPAAFAAPPEPVAEPAPVWTGDEFPAVEAEEPPGRNPLALVLSIGGVLVFLAVVLYLSMNRPPSERISSTSLTAADTLAAPIETGPQAAPLTQTEVVPETIRVAPTNPAPPVQPRPTPPARDSAAKAPPAPVADSAAGQ